MRRVVIDFPIDGLDGEVSLEEPTLSQVRPHLGLMAKDTNAFMLEMLPLALRHNGEPVPDALDRLGMSVLPKMVPLLVDLIGLGGDQEEGEP